MASSQIVPHCEIKGVDVCGFNTKKVIIRSDLGVYIETDTLRRPLPETLGNRVGIRIRPLHRKCMNGDHYVAIDSIPMDYWSALRCQGVLGVLKRLFRAIIVIILRLCWGLYTMPIYVAQGNAYSPPTLFRRIIPPQVLTPQFYIIRGKEFSQVTDLTSNSNVSYRKLHPDCQGGKFYLASTMLDVQGTQLIYRNCFYIIFDDNTCLRVPSMCEADYVGEKSMRFELHEECRNGLYYFGSRGYFFIMKQLHCHWGLQYHRTTDLKYDDDGETIEIRMSVSNFLPGGLALQIGSVSGRWLLLHKICNNNSEFAKQVVINIKVGFDKESCLKILNSAAVHEDLALSLFKAQLSRSPCFGGCGMDCSDKGWCKKIAKTEEVEVQPGKSVYIWQYVHYVGEYSIFYHQEIATSNSESDIPPIPKLGMPRTIYDAWKINIFLHVVVLNS